MNMILLHALTLTLMGRFTSRLYVGYSSWYAIGTLASMQVPFVGFQPVRTSEHMGALGMSIARFDCSCLLTPPSGVFGLLQIVAFVHTFDVLFVLFCYSPLESGDLALSVCPCRTSLGIR